MHQMISDYRTASYWKAASMWQKALVHEPNTELFVDWTPYLSVTTGHSTAGGYHQVDLKITSGS